jgi:hypothetical protein
MTLTENVTLRGLVHSTDLRTLALWAAPAALRVEADLGPVPPERSLEGRWDVHVKIVGGVDEADTLVADFDFRADHTVRADGPPAEDGDPHFIGIGYWISFPDGSFVFQVNHPGLPDGQGGSSGGICACHRGRIDGEGCFFTTEAFAMVDQGAGKPFLGPIHVAANGTRRPGGER